MRYKIILNIFIFCAIVGVGYGLMIYFDGAAPPLRTKIPSNEQLQSSQAAPDFSFMDMDGKKITLSDFKGKIVVLNFWATWCPPCVKEFPALLSIARAYPDRVVLIALSSDIDDAALKRFLNKHDWRGENIKIGRDMEDITGKKFQTYRLPETLIIDEAGQIREKIIGGDWKIKDLKAIIEKL
jgi:cytochrome c biogenesis protein CcmG/thiol:disulfide interchange protein DsbE